MHQPETSSEPGTARRTNGSTRLVRLGVIGATAFAACLTAAPTQAIPGDDVVKETGKQAARGAERALSMLGG